jgi:5-methylcytosine-specific restriction endonuclease McrA
MNRKIQGLTKEKLTKLYWKDNLSLSQIGKKLNCSVQTILNYFKNFNIERRSYSESLKGRKITWSEKIGRSLTGKKLLEKTKRKISETRKQNNISSCNKGLTKAENPELVTWGCKADKHWNWKGGISKENKRLRQTSEYKLWRKQCFQRDKYTCQDCGKTSCYLNVHHKIPFAQLLKEKKNLFKIENGITLCKNCHKNHHHQ